jgi:hypothetical protein
MAESDNILTKLQDLLVYLIPQLNKFPRDQKFVLGDRIETKLLDVQEFCLRAYYSRERRGHLLEANLQLEVARHLVRLANALKLFSNHTYGVLAESRATHAAQVAALQADLTAAVRKAHELELNLVRAEALLEAKGIQPATAESRKSKRAKESPDQP